MMTTRKISLQTKLRSLTIATITALCILFALLLSNERAQLLSDREDKVRNLVEAAQTMIAHYENLAMEGKLDTVEAKKLATAALSDMRYNKDDYFWVNDLNAVIVMHPIKPELNGKDLSQFKDKNGKFIFVEFVNTVKAHGAGFVSYVWPKPGFDEPVPKISYVKGSQVWHWVVGSGIYLDDVDALFRQNAIKFLTLSLLIGGIISVALILVGRDVIKTIGGEPGAAADIATKVAEGDLTVQIAMRSGDNSSLLFSMQSMVTRLSEVITSVRSGSTSLASASEELSATAQSLSESSNEQAASVEETSAAIAQMTASISQNSENAKLTDSMASKASKQATEGSAAVSSTVEAIRKIAGKIGIVDDIAYQTNLLALNAAIEASHAGEHGKGFAVVAAEVRKLAEHSQMAAKEIGDLASSSVDLAEKAGKLLDEMVPNINETSDLVQEIAAASSEQSSGVAQINSAMDQLNRTTQQNASASEELAATAEEMGSQTEQLQGLMTFFKLDSSDEQGVSRMHRKPSLQSRTTAIRESAGGAKTVIPSADPLDADPQVFDSAIGAHSKWKSRLRMCIVNQSKCPDSAVAGQDNVCELGKWIYGEGQRFSDDNEFQQLRKEHAGFHSCAATIISSVQQGRKREAESLLDGEYGKISTRVISILNHLKSRCSIRAG
jgi:methyl-accepting chemotaxis protein